MTRAEWEHEERQARQAVHHKHERIREDREHSGKERRKHQHRDWKKILTWSGIGLAILIAIFLIGYLPLHERNQKTEAAERSSAHKKIRKSR